MSKISVCYCRKWGDEWSEREKKCENEEPPLESKEILALESLVETATGLKEGGIMEVYIKTYFVARFLELRKEWRALKEARIYIRKFAENGRRGGCLRKLKSNFEGAWSELGRCSPVLKQ